MSDEASDYWQQYYDADEVAEIRAVLSRSSVESRGRKLCVRCYLRELAAPTVLIAHGLLGYGLSFARFHLPFYRQGFNVVQFDLPGFGESEGPRGGCAVDDFIQAWLDVIAYSRTIADGPRCVVGNAEDGVVGYYAGANHPDISAISVHTLFEYGDPGGVDWVGPDWVVRSLRPVVRGVAAARPTLGVRATRTIPWPHVFAGPDDLRYRQLLENDPLSLHKGSAKLNYSLVQKRPPPVRFEDCRTPVQVIVSEESRIWSPKAIMRGYERLGGPKQLVVLPGKPHWEASREFHDMYCDHVIQWIREVTAGGESAATGGADTGPPPNRAS